MHTLNKMAATTIYIHVLCYVKATTWELQFWNSLFTHNNEETNITHLFYNKNLW